MQFENLELVKPAVEHGPAYLDMLKEHFQVGERYGYNNTELARADFAQFVHELEEEAAGIGLPPEIPAQQTYLLFKDGTTVLGEIRLRPGLMPPYERWNGHVAYNIRPLQRGKGYATRQLALLLEETRTLGLAGISLTIDGENPASVRVIEKNGGKLLRVIEDPIQARVTLTEEGSLQVVDAVQSGQKWQLYWIAL